MILMSEARLEGVPASGVELCSTEIEPGRSQCRIEFIRFQSRAVQAAPELALIPNLEAAEPVSRAISLQHDAKRAWQARPIRRRH